MEICKKKYNYREKEITLNIKIHMGNNNLVVNTAGANQHSKHSKHNKVNNTMTQTNINSSNNNRIHINNNQAHMETSINSSMPNNNSMLNNKGIILTNNNKIHMDNNNLILILANMEHLLDTASHLEVNKQCNKMEINHFIQRDQKLYLMNVKHES